MSAPEPDNPPGPSGYRTLPPRVTRLILSLAFEGFGVGYLTVYITAYLPEAGFSSSSVGFLLGVFGLSLVAAAFPLGILSDRKGRKNLFLIGLSTLPVEFLVFAVTSNLSYLLIATVFVGVSEAATLATWNAIIADQTTPENRDKAFSMAFIVNLGSIGLGSAIPLAFPVIQNVSGLGVDFVHRAFMAGVSLSVLASPILASLLLGGYSELAKNEVPQKKRAHLRTLLKFSFLNGLLGFGTGLIIPLIPTWFLLKFGVQDTYTGPLLALASLTVAMSAAISPRFSRRYGLVKSIVMVQGVATVFMISLGFAPIPLLAASFFVARAGFMYMGNPLADSYLMGIMEAQERGLASAVNSVMWELPQSASTILGGAILGSGSYTSPFLLAALFYAVSISLFYSLFRNLKPRT